MGTDLTDVGARKTLDMTPVKGDTTIYGLPLRGKLRESVYSSDSGSCPCHAQRLYDTPKSTLFIIHPAQYRVQQRLFAGGCCSLGVLLAQL